MMSCLLNASILSVNEFLNVIIIMIIKVSWRKAADGRTDGRVRARENIYLISVALLTIHRVTKPFYVLSVVLSLGPPDQRPLLSKPRVTAANNLVWTGGSKQDLYKSYQHKPYQPFYFI